MTTWRLFRELIPWQDLSHERTPLFVREQFDASRLRPAWRAVSRVPPPVFALLALLYAGLLVFSGSVSGVWCVNSLLLISPLAVLLPSLLLWALPLGLALGPILAREREHRTWDVLRATPFSAEEILRAKARGALWSLRQSSHRLWSVQGQVLIALLLGGGVMLIFSHVSDATGSGPGSEVANTLCGELALLAVLGSALYLLDRAQQLGLMVVAALATSSDAATVRAGLSRAIGAAFMAWAVDAAGGVLYLALQPAGVVTDRGFSVPAALLLGPVAGYLIELDPLRLLAGVSLTLAVREIALAGLWARAVRGAEML